MKSMNDRKMDAKAGMPKSEPFFPENPERKVYARAGEINNRKYPDTEEAVLADQNQAVRSTNSGAPKPEFRH